MSTNLHDAADQFAAVWSLQDTAYEAAPALQCVEIDVLVDLLRAAGAPSTTLTDWLDAHALSDPDCQGHSARTSTEPSPIT
ncbi:hypothetical protein ABZW47_31750 [Streptomyces sp. NPDC004549]|uniref:hypothetical protein n=1 Tax=Streptomyces sp. NPDC004549 TaxID=3154283 RepID=UPI0033B9B9EB